MALPPLTPPLQLRRPPPSLRSIGCAALLRHHCAARSGRSLPLRGPFPATVLKSWAGGGGGAAHAPRVPPRTWCRACLALESRREAAWIARSK